LPNAWGLYDMHGNVVEWCLDWYSAELKGGEDPKGLESGEKRVIVGGAWDSTSEGCRSVWRSSQVAHGAYVNYGFRVVINLP